MQEIQAGITKKRLLGGIAVLVVATAVLIPLGVEPVAYFSGVAVGIVALGLVYVWATRRRQSAGGHRAEGPSL